MVELISHTHIYIIILFFLEICDGIIYFKKKKIIIKQKQKTKNA